MCLTVIVLMCFSFLSAFLTCADEGTELVYGLIGKEVQLDPKVTETISSITWKKQKDKIAEWDGSGKPEYYGRCSKDQCDLNPITGVLVIKGLKPEDEEQYFAEINNKGPAVEFQLIVLMTNTYNILVNNKPVSKPRVTTSCNETQCLLVCKGKDTEHTKYSWKENSDTLKDINENALTVQKSGEQSKSYTCVFSNPKSEEHSDPLTQMDLFPGQWFNTVIYSPCSSCFNLYFSQRFFSCFHRCWCLYTTVPHSGSGRSSDLVTQKKHSRGMKN
uniref:Ig-like domain-containing protein n=1 Tax=Scleropages formosus TaxID=113540 RepID=A0A8C9U2T8_SCLFO